jgi:hypothetical protein
MDRTSKSVETSIRYWVHQEEKKHMERELLRYRREKNWNLIAGVCNNGLKTRETVEKRFFV